MAAKSFLRRALFFTAGAERPQEAPEAAQ